MFSQYFPGVSFEFDNGLDQAWVLLQHKVRLAFLEGFLYEVARVVESWCANVAASAFETVRLGLHLIPVLRLNSYSDGFHIWV